MATPFTVLFDEFLQTEVDDSSILALGDDLTYQYLSDLLLRAREEFRDIIYSNVNVPNLNKAEDVSEFQRQTYNFSVTGTNTTQVLNPAPPTSSEFYITVNNVETTSFTFNSGNNEITITNMPNQANTIFIGAYVNGEFNQTLTLTERGIFVDLMGIIYLKDKKKKALHINQSVYGSDYRMHSQASHIRALDDMYNINYELILRKINLYTYRNSLDSLKRLGGKV